MTPWSVTTPFAAFQQLSVESCRLRGSHAGGSIRGGDDREGPGLIRLATRGSSTRRRAASGAKSEESCRQRGEVGGEEKVSPSHAAATTAASAHGCWCVRRCSQTQARASCLLHRAAFRQTQAKPHAQPACAALLLSAARLLQECVCCNSGGSGACMRGVHELYLQTARWTYADATLQGSTDV